MKITNLLNTYAKKATTVATEAYKTMPSIDLKKAIIQKEKPSEDAIENKIVESTPVEEITWKDTFDKIRNIYSESVEKSKEVKSDLPKDTEVDKKAFTDLLQTIHSTVKSTHQNILNPEKNVQEKDAEVSKVVENSVANDSLKDSKTLKEKILSSSVTTGALDYSVSALQKSGTLGRIVAVGAAREVLNKNPITHIASTAILGAARATLPENKVTKGILDLSHEIVHGEIPKVDDTEDSHKKKGFFSKYTKNLSNKTSIAFILGAIFMIVIKKIL